MVKLTVKGVKEILVLDDIRYESAEEFFRDLAFGLLPARLQLIGLMVWFSPIQLFLGMK